MTVEPVPILVNIQRLKDWYAAFSDDVEGFYMAWDNLSELIQDIPKAIQVFYKAKHGQDVKVTEAGNLDSKKLLPMRYILRAA